MALLALLAVPSSPVMATANCHLRSPKRCGPILSGGGHHLSVLSPAAHPPPNLLYVSRSTGSSGNISKALVCVPAKSGSTSFYFWLYQALAGQPWPYTGDPWIQDVSSERWANLTGVRVARFAALPFRQRNRALSDTSIRRFALTRDPLERALSAYYSKIACETGDAGDHAGAIRQLMKQAPREVTKGLGRGSDLNRSVPCLSAVDWGRMVLEARLAESTRWEVNAHFMTQADACGFHDIGYHMLIPLEDNGARPMPTQSCIAPPPFKARTCLLPRRRHAVDTIDARSQPVHAHTIFTR